MGFLDNNGRLGVLHGMLFGVNLVGISNLLQLLAVPKPRGVTSNGTFTVNSARFTEASLSTVVTCGQGFEFVNIKDATGFHILPGKNEKKNATGLRMKTARAVWLGSNERDVSDSSGNRLCRRVHHCWKECPVR